MNDAINFCFDNKCVASIYRDYENPDRHLTGFVERFNDSEVLISHITPSGLYDGYVLLLRDSIFRIDYNGKYENMINRLYHLKGQSHRCIDTLDDGNNNLLFSLLDYAIKEKYIVSVCFDDGYETGIVVSYTNENLTLDIYDIYGDYNGRITVIIDDIISLNVDSEENQSIKLLLE